MPAPSPATSPGLLLADSDGWLNVADRRRPSRLLWQAGATRAPLGLNPDAVQVPLTGAATLPKALAPLADQLRAVACADPERFFDGPGAVLEDLRVHETSGTTAVTAHARRTSFFDKLTARGNVLPARRSELCRRTCGAPHQRSCPTMTAVQSRLDALDVRPADLMEGHPLRWPGAGAGFSVLCRNAEGVPALLMHRRSHEMSAAPGTMALSVGEGFALEDFPHGLLDLGLCAERGAAEELNLDENLRAAGLGGLRRDMVRVTSVYRDEGAERGYQFVGVYDLREAPAGRVEDSWWEQLYRNAPSAWEATAAHLVPVQADAVARFIIENDLESFSDAAVLVLLTVAEALDPGAAARIERMLRGARAA